MKKILFSAIALGILSVALQAAFLTGESTSGMKKICYYDDGSAITISYTGICPLSI